MYQMWYLIFIITGNSLLTRRVLPESMILSNMTGRALWQTFANITTDDDNKSAVADKQYTKQMDKDKLLIVSSSICNMSPFSSTFGK